jgi:hypothetical protein
MRLTDIRLAALRPVGQWDTGDLTLASDAFPQE